GETGATGERGPSDAVVRREPGRVALPPSREAVGSLRLPPGEWILTVTGVVHNESAEVAEVVCAIDYAGGSDRPELRLAPVGEPGDSATLASTGRVAGGTRAVECRTDEETVGIEGLSMTAIQVAGTQDQSPA
ncbi:MAG TPA: hypothetical protein VGW10_02890, partial [Solirubrobacteraceae bacterium]|nr:hypothetical protein [Solirubrobacteraceae bacterium]